MSVKQISIFMENRPGRISAVTKLLGDGGIDIRAMALADTTDFGILRIIVDDEEKCIKLLADAGYSARATAVVAVGFEDKPGALASVMEVLYNNNISVEYMYSFISNKEAGKAYIMLRVDDNDAAAAALEEKGFTLLNSGDLFGDK